MTPEASSTGTPDAGPSRSPRRVNRTDLIAGAASAVLGVAVLPAAVGMPRIAQGMPGPGLFPGIIGVFLVLFGLVLVVGALRGRRVDVEEEAPAVAGPTVSTGRRWLNGGVVLAGIAFYIVAAETLGFLVTITLVVLAVMITLGARWWVALITAVAVAFALLLVFEEGLLVQLPDGLVG
ncbi:tripartite tricarboxylate transporter TctB family protein [Ornithinicoccus halotolerans]|uniref:tripartite tricarboxylate transporter TctB family protein n=1 Tax=Ornithinicoccus halotolerans TaxID=1748220 RepID=UPI0018860987|nr:tripartite tricarboxylate transporter TctB family protein [Ornithinicoccus halotolerans]